MRRDDIELEPRRSVNHLVVPIGLVAVVVANTVWVGIRVGSREEKLDNVAVSVSKIEAEMYRRSDAEKDGKVIEVRFSNLERRVDQLETARQRHVDAVQAKVEKQEEDVGTRVWRYITGNITGKPR